MAEFNSEFNPKLIAICGFKGAGKSTLTKFLQTTHGYESISLSEPVKKMLETILKYQGVSINTINRMLFGDLKETSTVYLSGKSPRQALQTLGTEWGREIIHPDFWLNIWQNQIKNFRKVVCDDLRFLSETKLMLKLNATIIRIQRGEPVKDLHISEQEQLQIPHTFVVKNNGTKDELFHFVTDLLGDLL
jgi:hypothetical protein